MWDCVFMWTPSLFPEAVNNVRYNDTKFLDIAAAWCNHACGLAAETMQKYVEKLRKLKHKIFTKIAHKENGNDEIVKLVKLVKLNVSFKFKMCTPSVWKQWKWSEYWMHYKITWCIMFKVIVGNGAFSGVITFSKNELLFIFRNDPFRQ